MTWIRGKGDSDSHILVSHRSEVTWTWVQVTHGFVEIFEKHVEGRLEGFKKEMLQKRYFQKRKISFLGRSSNILKTLFSKNSFFGNTFFGTFPF